MRATILALSDVAFGSIASFWPLQATSGLPPNSGHHQIDPVCPVRAKSLIRQTQSIRTLPRLRLQPEDEQSGSIVVLQSRQSAFGSWHSSLERNCLRRELRCCYLPRLSNMFRSMLSCRRPFLCFRQGCPAIEHCSLSWCDLIASQ
jgi:hypothetical protein